MALLGYVVALPPSAYVALLLLGLISFAGHRIIRDRRRRHGLPLPPGPPGEPLIGHLRIIPVGNPEYAYMRWGREYNSDVLSFNILGQPIIVLNSARAAIDLLDKRGANYADRPRFVLFEAMGWGRTLTFLRAGSSFRLHRRILQKRFQKSAITIDQPLQTSETRQMLRGIAQAPDNWEMVMRRFATAIVLGIGFGIDITSDADPFIQMAEDASYALGHGGAPAGTPVDYFPFLKSLPSWMVDRSLRFARDWSWAIRQIHDKPYEAMIQADGGEKQSLIHSMLAQQQTQVAKNGDAELEEADIKGAAAAVYAAGQDTTWATLVVFVLNMVLNPGIQRKAQRLLDEAIGDRLPVFSDRNLPALRYIEYIVYETLRWCPVSPVGVPHRAMQDDVYNGMFIPAGSYVYANGRAITHDPQTFTNPDSFNPDRYVSVEEGGLGEPLPVGQFGFGRRICVGQHLAQASVWIAVASMLKVFDIKKAVGLDGAEIVPDVKLTNGLTSHPQHFPCRFELRNSGSNDILASI